MFEELICLIYLIFLIFQPIVDAQHIITIILLSSSFYLHLGVLNRFSASFILELQMSLYLYVCVFLKCVVISILIISLGGMKILCYSSFQNHCTPETYKNVSLGSKLQDVSRAGNKTLEFSLPSFKSTNKKYSILCINSLYHV